MLQVHEPVARVRAVFARKRRSRRSAGFGAILLLGLTLPMIVRAAPPAIFHSPADDGQPAAYPVTFPVGSPVTLHLYYRTGSRATASGEACVDGDGEEVCAIDLVVESLGGSQFLSFAPDGNTLHALSSTSIRMNEGQTATGALGSVKLGDLVVDAAAAGMIDVTSARSVSARLELDQQAPFVVARVPEPTFAPALLVGALALSRLGRTRGGRRDSQAIRR